MGNSLEKMLDSTKILEQKCEQINNKIKEKKWNSIDDSNEDLFMGILQLYLDLYNKKDGNLEMNMKNNFKKHTILVYKIIYETFKYEFEIEKSNEDYEKNLQDNETYNNEYIEFNSFMESLNYIILQIEDADLDNPSKEISFHFSNVLNYLNEMLNNEKEVVNSFTEMNTRLESLTETLQHYMQMKELEKKKEIFTEKYEDMKKEYNSDTVTKVVGYNELKVLKDEITEDLNDLQKKIIDKLPEDKKEMLYSELYI